MQLPLMRDHLPALRQLALMVRPNGHLVEVGSFAGESTRVFLETGLRVDAIDPWDNASRDRLREGTPDFDPSQRWYFDMSDAERQFDRLLSQFPDRLTKLKGYDWQYSENYSTGSLDAVYLDAVHTYEETLASIRRWHSKVKSRGILCGHDYAPYYPGVVQAVRESVGEPDHLFADTSWMIVVGDTIH